MPPKKTTPTAAGRSNATKPARGGRASTSSTASTAARKRTTSTTAAKKTAAKEIFSIDSSPDEDEDQDMNDDDDDDDNQEGEQDDDDEGTGQGQQADSDDEEEDEEEDDRKRIPPELLTRVLHEFFPSQGTRVTRNANEAVAKYMDIFVREAIARAAAERKGMFLEVCDTFLGGWGAVGVLVMLGLLANSWGCA